MFLIVHFALAGASFEIKKKHWKKTNTIYRDVEGTRASESKKKETVFLIAAGASFEIQKKHWNKTNTIYRDVEGTRASESRR